MPGLLYRTLDWVSEDLGSIPSLAHGQLVILGKLLPMCCAHFLSLPLPVFLIYRASSSAQVLSMCLSSPKHNGSLVSVNNNFPNRGLRKLLRENPKG